MGIWDHALFLTLYHDDWFQEQEKIIGISINKWANL